MFHDEFADRKPEPGPLNAFVEFLEPLEDAGLLLERNAASGVPDGEHRLVAPLVDAQRECNIPFGGELGGVHQQVDEHLLEPVLVGIEDQSLQPGLEVHRRLRPLDVVDRFEHVAAQRDHVARRIGEPDRSPLESREIDHVADELQQQVGILTDIFAALPARLVVHGLLARQDCRESHDRVERRAQFVAHVRQEEAFGADRIARGFAHGQQGKARGFDLTVFPADEQENHTGDKHHGQKTRQDLGVQSVAAVDILRQQVIDPEYHVQGVHLRNVLLRIEGVRQDGYPRIGVAGIFDPVGLFEQVGPGLQHIAPRKGIGALQRQQHRIVIGQRAVIIFGQHAVAEFDRAYPLLEQSVGGMSAANLPEHARGSRRIAVLNGFRGFVVSQHAGIHVASREFGVLLQQRPDERDGPHGVGHTVLIGVNMETLQQQLNPQNGISVTGEEGRRLVEQTVGLVETAAVHIGVADSLHGKPQCNGAVQRPGLVQQSLGLARGKSETARKPVGVDLHLPRLEFMGGISGIAGQRLDPVAFADERIGRNDGIEIQVDARQTFERRICLLLPDIDGRYRRLCLAACQEQEQKQEGKRVTHCSNDNRSKYTLFL